MFSDFWLLPLFLSFDPKCKGKFRGLKQHFQSKMIKFHRISRTSEAVQGLSSLLIKDLMWAFESLFRWGGESGKGVGQLGVNEMWTWGRVIKKVSARPLSDHIIAANSLYWYVPICSKNVGIKFLRSKICHTLGNLRGPLIIKWKKLVLTPAQKKQGSLTSKQYFIFLLSQGRAHFHTLKKLKIHQPIRRELCKPSQAIFYF